MTSPITDTSVVIEEIPIERPGPSPWLVLGAIAAVVAVVFGVRSVRASRRRSRPATPTVILPR